MQIDNLGQAEVKWSGTGRAVIQVVITLIPLCILNKMIIIIQAVLEYYGCNCCQQSRAFNLTADATFDSSGEDVTHMTLKMCFQ